MLFLGVRGYTKIELPLNKSQQCGGLKYKPHYPADQLCVTN
jgi:hypothetical protein